MKCQSCAAPVSRIDRSGRYICDFCSTEAVATAIGDSVDRLVLTEVRSDFACPDCFDQVLRKGSMDSIPLAGCGVCQGVLIPRSAFAILVQARRSKFKGIDVAPEFDPAVDGPRAYQDRLTCPACRGHMESFFYAGPGRVAIDACNACDAVWLDCGEITRIEESPGLRGQRF